MVVYTCERCNKFFNKKFEYDKHINKISNCYPHKNDDIEPNDYYCEICCKNFSRIDALKRHNKSKKHIMKMSTHTKKININPIKYSNKNIKADRDVNINNNSNNNYYFISPFGQEEIAKLTTIEKMSTLLSKENPIVEIILITNLNPQKPEYHNVGYTDLKSGYGVMFNGKTWEKKEVNTMINDLLLTKKNDLFKIRLEMSPFLSSEHKKIIEEKLLNVKDNVEPRLEHHVTSKKKLVTNLKTHFVNGKAIIQQAIKNSGASFEENKSDNTDSWMNEYNFEDIDKQINLMNMKKNLVKFLAREMAKQNYSDVIKLINEASSLAEINVIDRLLSRSLISKIKIDQELINKEILKDMYINNVILNKE